MYRYKVCLCRKCCVTLSHARLQCISKIVNILVELKKKNPKKENVYE